MSVAEYLKDCRESKGRTQRQVSLHLGWSSAQFVSNIERGISLPPKELALKWCRYIGADPKVLRIFWVEKFDFQLMKELRLKK